MHNDRLDNRNYRVGSKKANQIYISVFVTAYKREQFIIEAVKSVLSQTLSREFFEVIVIKSFINKEVDEFLSRNGIKTLYIDDDRYGYRFSKALEISKGNIVVTLDDDDIFLPSFLDRIIRAFSESDSLCAYQKSLAYFSISEKIYLKRQSSLRRIKIPSNFVYDLGDQDGFHLAISLNAAYGQLVIKKNSLLPYLNYIQNVKTSLDTMLFVIAALENCKVFHDPEVSTLVRMHENSESMLSVKQLDLVNLQKKVNSIKKLISDYTLFIEMSKKHNNAQLNEELIRLKNFSLFAVAMSSTNSNFSQLCKITVERLKISIRRMSWDPIEGIGDFFKYLYFFGLHIINQERARRIFFMSSSSGFEKSLIPFRIKR